MYIEPDDPLQFTGKIYQTDMASHLKNLMASDTCSKIEATLWRYERKKLQETSGLRAELFGLCEKTFVCVKGSVCKSVCV